MGAEREKDRQTDRQTETERDLGQRDRQTDRDRERCGVGAGREREMWGAERERGVSTETKLILMSRKLEIAQAKRNEIQLQSLFLISRHRLRMLHTKYLNHFLF